MKKILLLTMLVFGADKALAQTTVSCTAGTNEWTPVDVSSQTSGKVLDITWSDDMDADETEVYTVGVCGARAAVIRVVATDSTDCTSLDLWIHDTSTTTIMSNALFTDKDIGTLPSEQVTDTAGTTHYVTVQQVSIPFVSAPAVSIGADKFLTVVGHNDNAGARTVRYFLRLMTE